MGGLFTTPIMLDYEIQNGANVLHPIFFELCKYFDMLTFE